MHAVVNLGLNWEFPYGVINWDNLWIPVDSNLLVYVILLFFLA